MSDYDDDEFMCDNVGDEDEDYDLEYSEDGPPAADEDRDWFPPEPPQGEGGDTEGGDYGDYSSDYEASPGSP